MENTELGLHLTLAFKSLVDFLYFANTTQSPDFNLTVSKIPRIWLPWGFPESSSKIKTITLFKKKNSTFKIYKNLP